MFDRLSRSLASRFNDEEAASAAEIAEDRRGMVQTDINSNEDQNFFRSVVPPTINTASEPTTSPFSVEDTKEDLLNKAKQRRREQDGPIIVRAGGGRNPAIKS